MRGGEAQLAVGGEFIDYELEQDIVRPNNTGPASTGSAQLFIPYARDVKSAYAELYLPFVGADAGRPRRAQLRDQPVDALRRLQRRRRSTTNPKIALNWGIVEAVMLRANYAEAFVAPALTSRGANEFGFTGESGFSGVAGQGLPGGPPTVSTASFPSAIGIPGCPAGLDDVLVEQRDGTVAHGRQRHAAAADGQELELRRRHHAAGGRQVCASASRSGTTSCAAASRRRSRRWLSARPT